MNASPRRLAATAAAALALLALAGCAGLPGREDLGPVRAPTNFRGAAAWPEDVRRVAVLPAHDATGTLSPEFVASYDAGWTRALAATRRAEFVAVPRATLADWSGRETLDSSAPLPSGLFQRVLAETGAQAVLFLDLTQVAPYPPLSLAFRARVAAAPAGDTLWMADEVFDTRDAATARFLRRAARAQNSSVGDPVPAVLQSPARLADHAFAAVAALLPPRVAPAPDASEKTSKTDADALNAKKFPARADNPN